MTLRKITDKDLSQILTGLVAMQKQITYRNVRYSIDDLAVLFYVSQVNALNVHPTKAEIAKALNIPYGKLAAPTSSYKKMIENVLIAESAKGFQRGMSVSVTIMGQKLCNDFFDKLSKYVDNMKFIV